MVPRTLASGWEEAEDLRNSGPVLMGTRELGRQLLEDVVLLEDVRLLQDARQSHELLLGLHRDVEAGRPDHRSLFPVAPRLESLALEELERLFVLLGVDRDLVGHQLPIVPVVDPELFSLDGWLAVLRAPF